mmetsp:Transcript_152482/g.266179  ORF Transcript_152482/g.266179 Transcript_152482/m.266179 type:complete len:315 (-) Transcript_152482:822-1766(-)
MVRVVAEAGVHVPGTPHRAGARQQLQAATGAVGGVPVHVHRARGAVLTASVHAQLRQVGLRVGRDLEASCLDTGHVELQIPLPIQKGLGVPRAMFLRVEGHDMVRRLAVPFVVVLQEAALEPAVVHGLDARVRLRQAHPLALYRTAGGPQRVLPRGPGQAVPVLCHRQPLHRILHEDDRAGRGDLCAVRSGGLVGVGEAEAEVAGGGEHHWVRQGAQGPLAERLLISIVRSDHEGEATTGNFHVLEGQHKRKARVADVEHDGLRRVGRHGGGVQRHIQPDSGSVHGQVHRRIKRHCKVAFLNLCRHGRGIAGIR